MTNLRSSDFVGFVLFGLGVILFLAGVAASVPPLFSAATLLFVLGWALPYVSMGRKSPSAITAWTVALPLLVTLGLFYFMASHADHIQSGLGFDLDHTTHNLIGFVILVAAEVLTLGVSRRSRPA